MSKLSIAFINRHSIYLDLPQEKLYDCRQNSIIRKNDRRQNKISYPTRTNIHHRLNAVKKVPWRELEDVIPNWVVSTRKIHLTGFSRKSQHKGWCDGKWFLIYDSLSKTAFKMMEHNHRSLITWFIIIILTNFVQKAEIIYPEIHLNHNRSDNKLQDFCFLFYILKFPI